MSWTNNGADGGWGSGGGDGGGDGNTTAPWEAGNNGNSFGGDEFGGNQNGAGDFGAGNDDGAGGGDSGCFNCGEPGHNKAECPNPRVFTGTCRHCNQEGHQVKDCPTAPPPRCGNCKAIGHFIDDCPKPLVCPRCNGTHKLRDCPEPAKCRHCNEEGHQIKDCPTYVPMCKNCGQENHLAKDCANARAVDRSHLPDISGEEAWKLLEQAIKEKDMDEVKEKIQLYVKAQPTITFVELEQALRSQGYGLFLVPLVKTSLAITLTNMDLQGNLGKKYTVNYRFSDKPRRPAEKEGWPKDHTEVLARLADAGDVVPTHLPKCSNCNELGHIAKSCPQERVENADRAVVKCVNCDEEGHRMRDCPNPRRDKNACRNCQQPGHMAADCTEPRSAEGVECRKCNEMGHFSKDCPKAGPRGCRNCGQEGHMAKECTEPRNMALVQCRNCDEMGHTGKECPKPRDISRVKCSNCQEMGHFKSKCPNPPTEEDAFQHDDGGAGFGNEAGGTADFGNETSGGNFDGADWGNKENIAVVSTGW